MLVALCSSISPVEELKLQKRWVSRREVDQKGDLGSPLQSYEVLWLGKGSREWEGGGSSPGCPLSWCSSSQYREMLAQQSHQHHASLSLKSVLLLHYSAILTHVFPTHGEEREKPHASE